MSLLISIIVFILILAVLVLVHEFGHFIVAKKSGIRVDEFGFGFPPRAKKLFEKNGTVFTLNWIPFGGFVKIFGENGEEGQEQKDSFASKPKLIQAAVLVAGPLFNFLFAWLIVAIMLMIGSPTLYDDAYASHMKDISVSVVEVVENSPADQAEIFVGDKIMSVTYENGSTIQIAQPEDLISAFEGKGVQEIILEVERKKDVLMIPVTPTYGLYEGQENPALGIALDEVGTLRLPPHKAIARGLERVWSLTVSTGDFLLSLIKGLLTGDSSQAGSVTGPVGIIPVVGNAIEIGFSFVVIITALISINLAIINLLPFPALDGGRLLFILIETIKGSPINPKASSWINGAGFFILITLMILVTIRDIINLF